MSAKTSTEREEARKGPGQAAGTCEKVLMKGNEAIGEGAIRAGCQAYFGYPITPQSEILEYMARRMPELGRTFVQAESELAAINMCFGAAAAGCRVMTSSSSPGISLKQEGISFIAAAELPVVVVNVMRAGPGLGGILPAQADYFQATKGGGHGDYHPIVLAPASVQEALDLTALAFDLADRYRTPVMILADGLIGQAMEPVVLKDYHPAIPDKPWALGAPGERKANLVKTLYLRAEELELINRRLGEKYAMIAAHEVRYEGYLLEDAEIAVVAFGTPGRVALSAVREARAVGIRAGLFRPISLYPFPYEALARLAGQVRAVLVVELSLGQMLEDVALGVRGRVPVRLYNRLGGMIPAPSEIVAAIKETMVASTDVPRR